MSLSEHHIEKVHMIILMQPNIQAAIEFYEHLGLKQIFHLKERWAEMKIGDIKIGLCPTAPHQETIRTGVVLQIKDLNAFYEENKDTISFINSPKEAVHGIMVSFKDPGGNIIDLYQPTPEKVTDLVKKTAESTGADDQPISSSCHKKENCCKKNDAKIGCA